MKKQQITITKKIAKHGSQVILVIPRVLEGKLKPGTLAQITFEIMDNIGGEAK
jgi:hypothetical protein